MVDDRGWQVRYLVVDTRNWWPGRKVLVAPGWVPEFRWAEREVGVRLTREQVERRPEHDPSSPPDRAYEEELHRYHGREPYQA